MALYGTGGTGIPFTGFTATLSDTPSPGAFGVTDAQSGTVQKNGLMQQDQKFNRIMHGTYNQVLRAKFQSLIGRTTGAFSVTSTKRRVTGQPLFATPSDPGQGGGVIPIETYTMINRPSNGADFNNLKVLVQFTRVPAYAADVSGNSGGGKLGY